MIACAMVVPLALIAGAIRGIPLGWRMIDCSFGVFGIVPLAICYREIKRLEREQA
jgi:Na+/melibiose symporter-like transporter